jgi:enamine deaminase RidA (YjgF/YER057c/UK114 family)
MPVEYLSPDGLHKNPAFSQVVVVTGPAKTVYVGAQDPVDASATLAGEDLGSQARQVLENVGTALEAAGAAPEHIVSWTIYVKQGAPLQEGLGAFQAWWGRRPNPPVNTVVFVAALGRPEWLISIEATAVVPLGDS